jgi:hypothetical protein
MTQEVKQPTSKLYPFSLEPGVAEHLVSISDCFIILKAQSGLNVASSTSMWYHAHINQKKNQVLFDISKSTITRLSKKDTQAVLSSFGSF